MQRTSSAEPKRERGELVRLPPGFFMLLLVCTASMNALVRAQQCASYDPGIAAGTPAQLCALYRLPSSLYENQALNLTQASSAALSSQQLQLAPVLPYECTRVFMPWVCATAYPLCSMEPSLVDPGLLLPVALPTCYETCVEAENACRAHWEELGVGELFPPCNATQSLTGLPIWPQNQSIFPIPPPLGPVPVQCSVPLSTPEEFVFPCPEDLEFNPSISGEPTCNIPCLPAYADESWRLGVYLAAVIPAWITFVFLLISLLFFALIPAYREWPRRMFIYLAVALFVLNIAFIMMTFRDYKTLNCHNDFYCGLQTFLLTSVALCAGWWWALTIIITFINVVWNTAKMNLQQQRRRNAVITEVICHIIGWGSALIPVIVYVAMDGYTVSNIGVSAASLVLCAPGSEEKWFIWVGVYLWLLISLVIVLILGPAIAMFMSRVSSRSIRSTIIRLLVYSLYYVVVLVFVVVNQGVKTGNVDRYLSQVEAWYQCTLAGGLDCPSVDTLTSTAFEVVSFLILNFVGTVFTCTIALTPRNLRYVRSMLSNLRHGRPLYDGLGTGTLTSVTKRTPTSGGGTGTGGIGGDDSATVTEFAPTSISTL
eukprot:CAMPEP_0177681838 /NCGR_PEP_ID=MMETSP0447-20121125/30936_1 /TAXON_ID=0 /ORGANISM="Stygamoeba regulata, Strain BSH-02190019" /LENGTH=596 /DNA_ID=CAMNT_0019191295 /DNA_START=238 /DNA_END=2028 /DNA_ORIENTATION=-